MYQITPNCEIYEVLVTAEHQREIRLNTHRIYSTINMNQGEHWYQGVD